MSVQQVLKAARRQHADRLAIRAGETAWTYAELDSTVDRLAAAFQRRGVNAGDRIAFLLPNGPELVLVDLACLALGAVAVPLNVRLTAPELAYVLNHCEARLCVAHVSLYPALAAARPDIPLLKDVFLVGPIASEAAVEPFESLLASANGAPAEWPALPLEAPAAILYTSGTTARPKGVTHTHGSLAATTRNFVAAAGLTPDDVVLGLLSMSHIFGFTLQLLSPLSTGATVLISPAFDPPVVFDLIARHRATHLYGLPVMFDALMRHPRAGSADTSRLRYCLAGGDAVSPALSEGLRKTLRIELHEGCGMTEVIPYALNRPGFENRVGSIGPPSVGMCLRIVNDAGEELPPEVPGEIHVHSEGLMAGYWNDTEATAAVLRDGWFRTGDIGRRDAAGYYWFVGRSKEIIVRGGSNISPLEVEGALSLHPAILEAAVVGVPHPTLGEIVAAFVALKPGTALTESDLKDFAGKQIAPYKVPEKITFLEVLPRGLTGKVQRKALKERAAADRP